VWCWPAWLHERGHEFKAQIATASLDPFRGYATALNQQLPKAVRVLDPFFHVTKLGLTAVDQVRRRVQQDTHGHRGHRGWHQRLRHNGASCHRASSPAVNQLAVIAAPITSTARLHRSANTPAAGEILQKLSSGHNAVGRFSHPGSDLAGPVGILRGENPAQVRDQRFLSSGRKASPRANFQSLELSCPDRLVG
jgi:hypothetical protein